MGSHLVFLGFHPSNESPDNFQKAAETYVTALLALAFVLDATT